MGFDLGQMITAGVAGGAKFVGDMIAGNATENAARINADAQRETNAMSINLANTAHQREMADLKAAGLNPLLSGTGGRGAETPALTAPRPGVPGTQGAVGNAMSQLPTVIMQMMEGQQQIELQRATADKTKAEADKVRAETQWVAPTNAQAIEASKTHAAQETQATLESKARTATLEAMRQPEINKIVADTALTAQQNRTEEQKTKEAIAAANNAAKLYGARASEAQTLASQAATYYANYFLKEHQQQIDKNDLQNILLNDEHYQKVIANILANDYGNLEKLADILSKPAGLPTAVGTMSATKNGIKPVTKLPY